ncbi:hypothetical protein GEV33_005524 [Tenebrio molitor]|uniref:Uncharacterized protein n=1 Tax=Tenebrio molitor TaxID=7067 RepID=A0A8J6LET3_TENMO|nr:hypothetical protein GEV33_005524 [Tenebrio molitor]
MIPTHLKVLTIEEKPFVYVRKLVEPQDLCTIDEIPCPHFNTSQDTQAKIVRGTSENSSQISENCSQHGTAS